MTTSRFTAAFMLQGAGGLPFTLEEVERIYYEGLKPLLDIDNDELFDILIDVFPDYLVGYYDAYLFYMKERLKEKLGVE